MEGTAKLKEKDLTSTKDTQEGSRTRIQNQTFLDDTEHFVKILS